MYSVEKQTLSLKVQKNVICKNIMYWNTAPIDILYSYMCCGQMQRENILSFVKYSTFTNVTKIHLEEQNLIKNSCKEEMAEITTMY